MVVPPLLKGAMKTKSDLRRELRQKRREHFAALPDAMRGLVFRHPPAPLLDFIATEAIIGLYHAAGSEAPASNYARFFHERGHTIALPRLETPEGAMSFRVHTDPFGETDLEAGDRGILQPSSDAEFATPTIAFVPLVGFTAHGGRLGQGGGYYDRWLAENRDTVAIGIAWDCQLAEELPLEEHDRPLHAVVTPTRFYGPF